MAKAGSGGSTPILVASPPLIVRVQWALAQVNDAAYYVRINVAHTEFPVSGDFSAEHELPSSSTQFDYWYYDWVQSGPYNSLNTWLTFRIDVVQVGTGTIVDSATTATLPVTIGTCGPQIIY